MSMSEQNTTIWKAPVATAPIDATVTIPGSKSLSNRFLILAALSRKPVRIEGLLRSRDTELMMGALKALGVAFQEDATEPTTVTVIPPAEGFTGNTEVFCGLAPRDRCVSMVTSRPTHAPWARCLRVCGSWALA